MDLIALRRYACHRQGNPLSSRACGNETADATQFSRPMEGVAASHAPYFIKIVQGDNRVSHVALVRTAEDLRTIIPFLREALPCIDELKRDAIHKSGPLHLHYNRGFLRCLRRPLRFIRECS